jgi:tRNA pseudouridine13 synthase
MKVKQAPEDFQVEEVTAARPESHGPFAFYQLRKRGLGTPEALQQICRAWDLAFDRLGYGGLKDRHAVTTQYLTIKGGPRRDLRQGLIHLRYLGQRPAPFSPRDIAANQFRITLRDWSEAEAAAVAAAVPGLARDGVANYFDDQRFGSVGAGDQFIARRLIALDYEGALKLALAEPYAFDRADQKEEKRILRDDWGRWDLAKANLPRGHARSIVTYLADHPTDFRGAFARLRKDLQSLYLAAYQSHLWNRMLAAWLRQHCRSEQLRAVPLRLGPAVFARGLDGDQRAACRDLALPLPSARLRLAADDPVRPLIDGVLAEEGLTLPELKLKHFREPFFARGDRAAFFFPENVTGQAAADDRHPGRHRVDLAFRLPRGCYATMVIKHLTPDRAAEPPA